MQRSSANVNANVHAENVDSQQVTHAGVAISIVEESLEKLFLKEKKLV